MFMETISPQPPASGRVALFLRTVGAFERDEIEAAVDGLIALLDAADGDPDVEPNGDELDASTLEWSPAHRVPLNGLAMLEDAEDDDPAEEDDPSGGNPEDDGERITWAEAERQPWCMSGGADYNVEDDDEDDARYLPAALMPSWSRPIRLGGGA